MMKDMMSKKTFGRQYNDLPLASEIIVDLKLKILKYRVLSLICTAVLVITACEVIANV